MTDETAEQRAERLEIRSAGIVSLWDAVLWQLIDVKIAAHRLNEARCFLFTTCPSHHHKAKEDHSW